MIVVVFLCLFLYAICVSQITRKTLKELGFVSILIVKVFMSFNLQKSPRLILAYKAMIRDLPTKWVGGLYIIVIYSIILP